jgi:hypothetical protein
VIDGLVVLARLAHMLAAAAWVGGGIAYAVAGYPGPNTGTRSFGWLARVCGWTLLLSGGLLTVDRLTGAEASTLYALLLAAKLALALAAFTVAGSMLPRAVARRRAAGALAIARPLWLTTPYLVLWLGIGVYAVGALMVVVYTRELTR